VLLAVEIRQRREHGRGGVRRGISEGRCGVVADFVDETVHERGIPLRLRIRRRKVLLQPPVLAEQLVH
jgi:hypothetical protein